MIKIDLSKIILGILVILLILGVNYHFDRIGKLNGDLQKNEKLTKALIDSMKTYINDNNELVSEKKTLQADIDELAKYNDDLTENQKELIKRINDLNEEKSVIAGALIETQIELNKLKSSFAAIDTINKTITFIENSKDIKYNIVVSDVLPYKDKLPGLTFNEFKLPNKTLVSFNWDNDKKEGYPISVSVTNTNKYIVTSNIDSYAIPGLNKEDVDPTFWNKFKKWIKEKSKLGVGIGIGLGAGAILFK